MHYRWGIYGGRLVLLPALQRGFFRPACLRDYFTTVFRKSRDRECPTKAGHICQLPELEALEASAKANGAQPIGRFPRPSGICMLFHIRSCPRSRPRLPPSHRHHWTINGSDPLSYAVGTTFNRADNGDSTDRPSSRSHQSLSLLAYVRYPGISTFMESVVRLDLLEEWEYPVILSIGLYEVSSLYRELR